MIFLICYAYDGFWQVRYVKVIQESHPEKQGDPSSRKFRQQWLDSCDEAEKEVIYRSAYTSYSQTSKMIPLSLRYCYAGTSVFQYRNSGNCDRCSDLAGCYGILSYFLCEPERTEAKIEG